MFPQSTRFLIVDDMPTMRSLIKEELKKLDYRNLVEAENGEDALKLMIKGKTDGPAIDVVISDWNMPKMSGLELLKNVRAFEEWKDLPFILVTSENERDEVTEAILAGVNQYIVKPFSGQVFKEKLQGVWKKMFGS